MNGLRNNIVDVLRVALPLLVSTGMFSLVLFTDRTLLYWYDGSAMSASMSAGNVFWSMICLPMGIASMTGAMIAQHVGAKQTTEVGKLLWQSVWLAVLFIPFVLLAAYFAPVIFHWTGQPQELIAMETTFIRILMIGACGIVLDSGLSGFFSGTERTAVIMWTSVASALLNLVLDVWLIFGGFGVPALGIQGAATASVIAFWLKPIIYLGLLRSPKWEASYQLRKGFCFNPRTLLRLVYFGFPAGLHSVAESGSFSWILLQIGKLGDHSLQATTMAINFNLVAFIPLVGLQVGTSVVVGRRLTESGPDRAAEAVRASLIVGMIYCALWAILYILIPDVLFSIYGGTAIDSTGHETVAVAKQLLWIVTAYLFLDAAQIILSGALRGAGDTWFVLVTVVTASLSVILLGSVLYEPIVSRQLVNPLIYWWLVMCVWVWSLGITLSLRYRHGRWRSMRMIDPVLH
jgi:MATE family multidrug resistance protein